VRIAFVSDTYWPRINGVTVAIDQARKSLLKAGFSVQLWAPQYPGKHHVAEEGVVRLPSWSLYLISKEDRLASPLRSKRLFAGLRQFRPDIIHAHTEFWTAFLARFFARRNGIPFVITCHTYFEAYARHYLPPMTRTISRRLIPRIVRYLFDGADAVIVPARRMQEVLVSYGVSVPVHVIPTGISGTIFHPVNRDEAAGHVAERFPQTRNRRILLSVSRLSAEKDPERVLRVFAAVHRRFPDVLLVFAGDGPQRGALAQQAAALGLEKDVLFAGYVPRETLTFWYSAAEAFVFASQTETQGLVTLEAMTCGTPVVAAGVMGTRDVMQGDNGGFMVEPDDTAFVTAIERLLDDRTLRAQKAKDALRHAALWSEEVTSEKLMALYRELAKGNAEKAPALKRAVLQAV
jgi:glycosyltransferase involved in cell wall biosynthesis